MKKIYAVYGVFPHLSIAPVREVRLDNSVFLDVRWFDDSWWDGYFVTFFRSKAEASVYMEDALEDVRWDPR